MPSEQQIESLARALYESHRTEYNDWPQWDDLTPGKLAAWLKFATAGHEAMSIMQAH